MLLSTFELLLKPQFPTDAPVPPAGIPDINKLSRTVIQAYFLTIANVNTFEVQVVLEFTVKFPTDSRPEEPKSFKDLIDAIDITGQNLFNTQLVPELVPGNDKARLTFTLPSQTTSLLVLQPDFISKPQLLKDANFEARGYVEISLPSLSGSGTATLLVTPQLRGTFFKDLNAKDFPDIGLDQIAYDLPVVDGGVFKFTRQKKVSTYQETCTNISVSGDTLSAACRRIDGSLNQTSLALKGIENIDGQLTVTEPNKPSTFQQSCTNISISGDILSATCKRKDGSLNQTSLVLNGIDNIDGKLEYTTSP